MKRENKILMAGACVAGATAAVLCVMGNRLSKSAFSRRPRTKEQEEADARRLGPGYVDSLEWYRETSGEEVSITGEDGTQLHATLLSPDCYTRRWAVCVHGYQGDRATMAAYARHYLEQGYRVLLPDLRGHGESEGGYMTMSARDGEDLVLWTRWIVRREEQAEIVLHGVSMGGSVVLAATGYPLPRQVKAAVSDCAYSRLDTCCKAFCKRRRLPYSLLRVPFNVTTRIRAGFWLRDAEPVRLVKKSVTPTLMIHSGDDHLVNPEMLPELYMACAAPKEWFVMPDCGHIAAVFRDPELYWQRVDGFLNRYWSVKGE